MAGFCKRSTMRGVDMDLWFKHKDYDIYLGKCFTAKIPFWELLLSGRAFDHPIILLLL